MADELKLTGVNSKGYGTVAKLVMQDRRISVGAKAIYAYFSSFVGAGDSCFPSWEKICFDLCIARGTLNKYLKELVVFGYIKTEQTKQNGRFAGNVYTISPCTNLPYTKKTATGKTVYGKLDANNNNLNNNSSFNNNRIEYGADKPQTQPRHKYGEYKNVLLSDEELAKLKAEFPDWEERIERLSEYIASTGKK